MKSALPSLLIVDDEANMRESLRDVLESDGYSVDSVDSGETALMRLRDEDYFMVITDGRMGGMSGYDLLDEIRRHHMEVPVLMMTAYATPKLAVQAIQRGAVDYLPKPFAPEELLLAVARCAERYALLEENARLKEVASSEYGLERIIGESSGVLDLRSMIQTVAPTEATVLILGESGTGKELIAGALHRLSSRRNREYVRINCAAIPDNLLESELFGHEKGAFTGALKLKRGRVEEADGGTIFLDEIGEMSRPLQAKLLRFLEDGTFTRVGGNEELRVNVRLIAATNRDIIHAIQDGSFREDLYHRLNVVQIRPEPLRARGHDILILARHFLLHFGRAMNKQISGFDEAAQQNLLHHHWPGNVRELRNVIERAVILSNGKVISVSQLPDFSWETGLKKRSGPPGQEVEAPLLEAGQGLDEALAEYEKRLIREALERHDHNLSRSAESLKMTRHALRYRMQRLNLVTTEGGGTDGTD